MEIEKGAIYVAPGGYLATEILEILPEGRCAFRDFGLRDGDVRFIYDEDLISRVTERCERLATPEEIAGLLRAEADDLLAWYPRLPLDRLLATVPAYRLKGEMERRQKADSEATERRARREVLQQMPAGDAPPENPDDVWLQELYVAFSEGCECMMSIGFRAWLDEVGDDQIPACWFVDYYPHWIVLEEDEPVISDLLVHVSGFMGLFEDVEEVYFGNHIANREPHMSGSFVSFTGMYKGKIVNVSIYGEPPDDEEFPDDDVDDDGNRGDVPPSLRRG